jgi:hypothetical protein
MLTTSQEQLLNFISRNNLKKEDGIICFDATIHFYHPVTIDAVSEIQIISLPYEHALYVINYPDFLPEGGDVYSTAQFIFCSETYALLTIKTSDEKKIMTLEPKNPCILQG